MSHLCAITTQFKSTSALKAAAQTLGWTFHTGGRVRYYRGPAEICDYTIELASEPSLQQTYNLGLQRNIDGTYRILCDNSMHGPVRTDGSLAGETPRILNSLRREYARQTILAVATRQGRRVQTIHEPDGRLRLRLSGGRH